MPKVTVITRKAYGGAYDVDELQAYPGRYQLRLSNRRDRCHGTDGAVNILFRKDLKTK